MKVLAILTLSLAAVLILVLVWRGNGNSKVVSQDVRVSYLGHTNMPVTREYITSWITNRTGTQVRPLRRTNVLEITPCVTLAITNPTSKRVICLPTDVIYHTPNGWVTNEISPHTVSKEWIGFNKTLEPATGFVFQVPRPASNGVLRLLFCCAEQSTGLAGVRDRITDKALDLQSSILATNPTRTTTYRGRMYNLLTEPLTMDPSGNARSRRQE